MGSSDAFLEKHLLGDGREEAMVLNVRNSSDKVTITLREISSKEMLDETLKLRVETFRVARLGVNDLLVDIHWIIIDEWGVSSMHLVDQNTKGPPIDRLAVTLVEQDFRRDVLGSSANSVGTLSDYLGETVIDKFEVAIIADHDIFGLQITVDDVATVKILEDASDLGAIETN